MGWTTVLVSGGLGIFGTAVGAFLGHYLSKNWQREQWIADNRKQEYRELLTTLTNTYMLIVRFIGPMMALDSQTQRELDQAERDSYRVIRDRLFIAKDLGGSDILRLWATAVENYRQTHDERVFAQRFSHINEEIVRLATRKLDGGE